MLRESGLLYCDGGAYPIEEGRPRTAKPEGTSPLLLTRGNYTALAAAPISSALCAGG